MNEFINRESNKLNRKRYVIEEVKEDGLGTIEEFIAYETRYDDEEVDTIVTEEGTKLDAESLTNIVSNISRNVTNQVLDEKEESLNEKINELSESKTNEILLEKESELTNKINELSEVKVFEVLNRIESDFNELVNEHNTISNSKVDFELSNLLDNYINIEWEVSSGEGVELTKGTTSTIVNVSRAAEDQLIKLKATYSYKWLKETKEHNVTIVGYEMSELVEDEVIVNWSQGSDINAYVFDVKTTDNSPITLNPTVLSGNNNEQYINVNAVRKTGCGGSVYTVTLEATEELINEIVTQPLVFESVWIVYVGEVKFNVIKELKVRVNYYPASSTPED